MGNADAKEQLQVAIEECIRLEREVSLLRAEHDAALEREVATLRAEKDSPHADAKYWRELQEARAKVVENRSIISEFANALTLHKDKIDELRAERDDALKRVAALMSHLEHWAAEHDRAVKVEALEEAAQVVRELGSAYGATAYRLLDEKAYADSSRYSNYASGLDAAAAAIRALATPVTDTDRKAGN